MVTHINNHMIFSEYWLDSSEKKNISADITFLMKMSYRDSIICVQMIAQKNLLVLIILLLFWSLPNMHVFEPQ